MHSNPSLKKVLKPVHLWALAVGLVISGEYFGWNLGWDVAGTGGFFIATILVTVFYVTFIFSFTELTAAIPQASTPHSSAGALALDRPRSEHTKLSRSCRRVSWSERNSPPP